MKTLNMKLKVKLGQRKKVSKEKQLQYDMNYILKKIKTGDIDLTKESDAIKYRIAKARGLIKEESLL